MPPTKIWSSSPDDPAHRRDATPRFGADSFTCIRAAIAAQRPPGDACAVDRRVALERDPEAVAAMQLNSPRIQIIDVDDEICDAQVCRPVVGGALVLKDDTHMTRTFARTLAPAVSARLNELVVHWSQPA